MWLFGECNRDVKCSSFVEHLLLLHHFKRVFQVTLQVSRLIDAIFIEWFPSLVFFLVLYLADVDTKIDLLLQTLQIECFFVELRNFIF
jgi:hypothetical protein